jgi:hypothetical protein
MKVFLLVFFFLPVCYAAFSQQNILDKRSKIKKHMEKFYLENKRTYSLTETSKTLTYTLTDSLSLPATYVYYFNDQNRCEKEETIYSCDSCMQIGITQSLSNKFINWKKVGPDSYYAGFPYNSLMEQIKTDDKFILRYTWMKRKDIIVTD